MQAIPGEIKTLVILISNEMPDKNYTDQNTIQPSYRLITCFIVISSTSLTSGQGIHDESATAFKVLSK